MLVGGVDVKYFIFGIRENPENMLILILFIRQPIHDIFRYILKVNISTGFVYVYENPIKAEILCCVMVVLKTVSKGIVAGFTNKRSHHFVIYGISHLAMMLVYVYLQKESVTVEIANKW